MAKTAATPGASTPAKANGSTPVENDQSDIHVSDIDSDIESEDLVPTYLKIKSKLYEIDPQLVETTTRKSQKGAKSKKPEPVAPQTPAVRKLLSQLQQLKSDTLFDEDEAEEKWPARRNQIAQNQAEKRQRNGTQPQVPKEQKENNETQPQKSIEAEVPAAEAPPVASEDDEDMDLLGEMFSAVPDSPSKLETTPNGAGSADVTIRDFGKASGVSPRKVLEEAVRSRYATNDLRFEHIN